MSQARLVGASDVHTGGVGAAEKPESARSPGRCVGKVSINALKVLFPTANHGRSSRLPTTSAYVQESDTSVCKRLLAADIIAHLLHHSHHQPSCKSLAHPNFLHAHYIRVPDVILTLRSALRVSLLTPKHPSIIWLPFGLPKCPASNGIHHRRIVCDHVTLCHATPSTIAILLPDSPPISLD